jgi:hypothetical protein
MARRNDHRGDRHVRDERRMVVRRNEHREDRNARQREIRGNDERGFPIPPADNPVQFQCYSSDMEFTQESTMGSQYHPTTIAANDAGKYGALVHTGNACMEHAIGACTRPVSGKGKCTRYHLRPGCLASNTSGRNPVDIGTPRSNMSLSNALGTTAALSWSLEQRKMIKFSRAQLYKKMEQEIEDELEAEQEEKEHAQQFAALRAKKEAVSARMGEHAAKRQCLPIPPKVVEEVKEAQCASEQEDEEEAKEHSDEEGAPADSDVDEGDKEQHEEQDDPASPAISDQQEDDEVVIVDDMCPPQSLSPAPLAPLEPDYLETADNID